ncbi:MAG: beta-L-arabinofuranosidase domain-containing protein, partial [Mycetocola sp.]
MSERVGIRPSSDRVDDAPRLGRGAPVSPRSGALLPLAGADVRITGGFWGERQSVNARATLRHCLDWMERLGWVGNFDRVAEGREGPSAGREFADSEIYKLLEALAWESGRTRDAGVESTFRSLSSRVIAAQQSDGYLNTRFGGSGQAARYSDLEWGHELYCFGHLVQAGVARASTVGVDSFVEAVIRAADHVCDVFGAGGDQRVCGHPEIEPALVELSRLTGNPRYLEQARLFVERRGLGALDAGDIGAAYFLDDTPVRSSDILRGHAVRALYLAAGAVDVAIETGDDTLLNAVATQWHNTVARRTYLTGGMGSRHEGESFGDDYELPSDRAYSETCAGIGSIMASWRLLLAQGQPEYADLIERTLFNVVAASPDAGGTAFFYVNPLQRNTLGIEPELDRPSVNAASSQRAPWFEVSCCPTNIARTVASLGCYLATKTANGLQIQQYAPSVIDTVLPGGQRVEVTINTEYPMGGTIVVTVGTDASGPWTLSLRVPRWAVGRARLVDDATSRIIHGASADTTRAFRAGDTLQLELPIEPRITYPDNRIDAIRGSIAVESGPLVLCAESTDLPEGKRLSSVRVPPGARPRSERGRVFLTVEQQPVQDSDWPYHSTADDSPDNG